MTKIIGIVLVALFSVMGSALAQVKEPTDVPLVQANFTAWQQEMQHQIFYNYGLIARCRISMDDCPADKREVVQYVIEKIIDPAAAHPAGWGGQIGWLNKKVNASMVRCGPNQDRFFPFAPNQSAKSACADCQDYVSWKYVVLLASGFSLEDLMVLQARIPSLSKKCENGQCVYHEERHVVVAVRSKGIWKILDSRMDDLVPLGDKPDFVTIDAFEPDPQQHASN